MCVIASVGRLNRSGMEACRAGRFDEAEANLLCALKQVQIKGKNCIEAKIRNNLGIVYELRGDKLGAQNHYADALGLLTGKAAPRHPLFARVSEGLARVSESR